MKLKKSTLGENEQRELFSSEYASRTWEEADLDEKRVVVTLLNKSCIAYFKKMNFRITSQLVSARFGLTCTSPSDTWVDQSNMLSLQLLPSHSSHCEIDLLERCGSTRSSDTIPNNKKSRFWWCCNEPLPMTCACRSYCDHPPFASRSFCKLYLKWQN